MENSFPRHFSYDFFLHYDLLAYIQIYKLHGWSENREQLGFLHFELVCSIKTLNLVSEK